MRSNKQWNKFSTTLILVLLVHAVILLPQWDSSNSGSVQEDQAQPRVIKIRNLGIEKAHRPGTFFSYSDSPNSNKIKDRPYMDRVKEGLDQIEMRNPGEGGQANKKLDLSQLDIRPKLGKGELKRITAMKALKLQGETLRNFVKGPRNQYMKSQNKIQTLKNSQVAVLLDVPEGVELDELNELEEKFYSFQKRMALTYVNSFFDKLSDFEFKNPQLQFPMTKAPTTLTARVTFDHNGNIQQIKMVKWTQIDKLQDFFVNVLDGIESLPNPPSELVKNKKSFNVYYTLNLN